MPAPSAGQILLSLALSLLVYAFLFSGTAVLVRRRYGPAALWGGTLVLTAALALLLSREVSRLGGATDTIETAIFLMGLIMILVPTSSAALVTDRVSRRIPMPGLGRHVGLALVAFLLTAPIGMVLGAAIDFLQLL